MRCYISILTILSAFTLGLYAEEHYITIFKAWRHGETAINTMHLLSGGGDDDAAGITALNDTGRQQARELGKRLVQKGPLDLIYSSDLIRAVDTAKGVIQAFAENGSGVELRTSKQLREIMHGKFDRTSSKVRDAAALVLLEQKIREDELNLTSEEELKDKFRFWKIHPLVTNEEIVPGDMIDVVEYLQSGETRPEVPYQLWNRLQKELIRIAKEHPGATIGISTHGACLGVLFDALNPSPKGIYLSPYYNKKEIKIGDTLVIPQRTDVPNGALIHLRYDSQSDKLELIN